MRKPIGLAVLALAIALTSGGSMRRSRWRFKCSRTRPAAAARTGSSICGARDSPPTAENVADINAVKDKLRCSSSGAVVPYRAGGWVCHRRTRARCGHSAPAEREAARRRTGRRRACRSDLRGWRARTRVPTTCWRSTRRARRRCSRRSGLSGRASSRHHRGLEPWYWPAWALSIGPGQAYNACMYTRVALTITLLSVSVSAAAQTWTPPRTPWGDPDLQGTTPTSTSRARRSSGRPNSTADASRTSRATSWPT